MSFGLVSRSLGFPSPAPTQKAQVRHEVSGLGLVCAAPSGSWAISGPFTLGWLWLSGCLVSPSRWSWRARSGASKPSAICRPAVLEL